MLKTLTDVSFQGSRFSTQLPVECIPKLDVNKNSVDKREAVLNISMPFTLTFSLAI